MTLYEMMVEINKCFELEDVSKMEIKTFINSASPAPDDVFEVEEDGLKLFVEAIENLAGINIEDSDQHTSKGQEMKIDINNLTTGESAKLFSFSVKPITVEEATAIFKEWHKEFGDDPKNEHAKNFYSFYDLILTLDRKLNPEKYG